MENLEMEIRHFCDISTDYWCNELLIDFCYNFAVWLWTLCLCISTSSAGELQQIQTEPKSDAILLNNTIFNGDSSMLPNTMSSNISQRKSLSVLRDTGSFANQALSNLTYTIPICKPWRMERFQSISQTQKWTKLGQILSYSSISSW